MFHWASAFHKTGLFTWIVFIMILAAVGPAPAASQWEPVCTGLTGGEVTRLYVWSDLLVAAGTFSAAGGISANSIAAWDGFKWSPLGGGMDAVWELATHNDNLIAWGIRSGGTYPEILEWNGEHWTLIAWTNRDGLGAFQGRIYQMEWEPAVDPFYPDWYWLGRISGFDGNVWQGYRGFYLEAPVVPVFAVINGLLYAATGSYVSGTTNGTAWTYPASPGVYGIRALSSFNGRICVGGTRGNRARIAVAKPGGGWSRVFEERVGCYDARVDALADYNGALVAGGWVPVGCNFPLRGVASWDGTSWSALGGDMDSVVTELAVYDGVLYAGGNFTRAGTVQASRIAQLHEIPTAVAFAGFTARPLNGNVIELVWDVVADEVLEGYHVFRRSANGSNIRLTEAMLSPVSRSYIDRRGLPGEQYGYFLTAYGAESGEVRSPLVHVELPDPIAFLQQNHPNPFNPSTTIQFTVREEGRVRIEVFDSRGASVRVLADAVYPPGEKTIDWDGTDQNGRRVASGVYFCRMRTDRFQQARKMVLLK